MRVMYKVRKIQEKDLDQLVELYHQLIDGPTDEKKLSREFKKILGKDSFGVFGVYEGKRLIGTATITKCLDLTADCRYYYSLENFVVDKEYRRKGVGKTLLEYIEEYGRKRKIRYICFVSSAERRSAHLFYEEMGYGNKRVKGFKKIL